MSVVQRGGDPKLVIAEYQHVIDRHIAAHPRSQQVAIGPSEIGDPCSRRIAYKLLRTPERSGGDQWRTTVGTAIHAWLEDAFDADNLRAATALGGQERWYIEETVTVGELAGTPITGHCDLYDRVTATVIDHKTTTPTRLKAVKRGGPSAQYRVQAHLYGRGWQRAGLPVDTVAIVFHARDGLRTDAWAWHEPYDEQIATKALQRLEGIQIATEALGAAAPAAFGTVDAYCDLCPFKKPGTPDLATGCPGHPRPGNNNTSGQLAGLLPQPQKGKQ